MKEIIINKQNEDTKLFRILQKLLPKAEKNFLYKMIRKKNITLNEKKAEGNELLRNGDVIKIFFSDETYDKFAGGLETDNNIYAEEEKGTESEALFKLSEENIIFEDEDIILCNKPAGILSQKADKDGRSMVEIITDYLTEKGEYNPQTVFGFKPAVANRLDRNTSGIIAAGKSVSGLKFLSEGFKKREFEKIYLCVLRGELEQGVLLNGLWSKSSHGNKVSIKNIEVKPFKNGDDTSFPKEYFIKGNVPVQTIAEPLIANGEASLALVRLLTGKTHQIRAQLAAAGHPLLGDYKYGGRISRNSERTVCHSGRMRGIPSLCRDYDGNEFNSYYKSAYGVEFQLLHAFFLGMPGKGDFFADIPDYYERLLKGEGLWLDDLKERIIQSRG